MRSLRTTHAPAALPSAGRESSLRLLAVVGLVLAGCLLALGLIIFTLEIRERVQDAAEKKLVVGAHVIGVQDPTVRVVRRTS